MSTKFPNGQTLFERFRFKQMGHSNNPPSHSMGEGGSTLCQTYFLLLEILFSRLVIVKNYV
jgi:hypothetical protein